MSKIDFDKVGFSTLAIHAGQSPDKSTGALSTPIYQTSTFCFETVEEGAAKFNKELPGFVYSRGGNPTTQALEEKMAAIESGEACVATASGMGAVGAIMVALLHTGDHVICGEPVYGGTSAVMRTNLPQFGVDVTFVDASDPKNVEAAVTQKTKLVYLETPANPTMKLADISAVAKIAHQAGARLVVDNTFAPPPIQFPLKLGADLALHSITKYINGHGDVIGGVVVGKASDIGDIRGIGVTKLCGTPPSPFNSYLALRGMKTLSLRVRQHCANALEVAQYLESCPHVNQVYYPGLASFPQHELAKRQMNGLYTGMLSFELQDSVKGMDALSAGKKLLNSLTIPSIAVSLGDPDTLIEHPASMTHVGVPKEAREEAGISDGLIRLSVGLEDAADLINDFQAAFQQL